MRYINDVDKAQIMDLCEPFMIPLMDDDIFEYGVMSNKIGRYSFVMVYVIRKDKEVFTWGDVKDNVIPMFHMLCKRYMTDDWSVEAGQQVHLWYSSTNNAAYYVDDLIFGGEVPLDSKVIKLVGLKLYQRLNWSGWGMRWQGESRR
jgi:hypothetical protein